MKNIKQNLLKYLLLMITLLSFQACTFAQEKDSFSLVINTMPLKYDKDKGGHLIDTKGILRFGQYSQASMFSKKYGKIEGPIASAWYIERAINGKPKYVENCGEELKRPKAKTWEEMEIALKPYYSKNKIIKSCYKSLTKIYKTQLSNEYFYAKALPNLKITYPRKHERHASWQAIVFKGRVGDLSINALSSEQKNNLLNLRAHKCYKWSSKNCCDLEGKSTSLYYHIREELFKKSKSSAKYSVSTEHIKDVRISPSVKWTQIKGIKINKEMYEYVYQQCRQGKDYCHFNNYKGSLSKEQKEYIKKVTWKTDKVDEK